jgi:hypothetical protein
MKQRWRKRAEEEKRDWERTERERMQREIGRWQRECAMLKEEISIIGSSSRRDKKKEH